jgi:hypothetical protein
MDSSRLSQGTAVKMPTATLFSGISGAAFTLLKRLLFNHFLRRVGAAMVALRMHYEHSG